MIRNAFIGFIITSSLVTTAHAAYKVGIYTGAFTGYKKVTKTYADGNKTVSKTHANPEFFDDTSSIDLSGNTTLTDDIKVLYRINQRVRFNEAHKFSPRDMWIGASHTKYGTVKAGRMLTPDGSNGFTPAPKPASVDGRRSNNSIRYESPTIKNTTYIVQYVMDEGKGDKNHDTLKTDGFAASVKYIDPSQKYKVAASHLRAGHNNKQHSTSAASNLHNTSRFSGTYAISDNIDVGAFYQTSRFNQVVFGDDAFLAKKEHAAAIFAKKQYDTHAPYVQLNAIKNPAGKSGESYSIALGNFYDIGDSNFYVGAEVLAKTTKIDVPKHKQTNKDSKKTEDIALHKVNTQYAELALFAGFSF